MAAVRGGWLRWWLWWLDWRGSGLWTVGWFGCRGESGAGSGCGSRATSPTRSGQSRRYQHTTSSDAAVPPPSICGTPPPSRTRGCQPEQPCPSQPALEAAAAARSGSVGPQKRGHPVAPTPGTASRLPPAPPRPRGRRPGVPASRHLRPQPRPTVASATTRRICPQRRLAAGARRHRGADAGGSGGEGAPEGGLLGGGAVAPPESPGERLGGLGALHVPR